MNAQLIIQITIGILVILGYVFFIYNYFRNPQENLDKKQALDKEESAGRDKLFEQRMQWEKESNEKRFTELGVRLTDSMTLAQNHIHTVDMKVDGLIGSVNTMNLQLTNEITKLRTIIEERFPKKTL